MESTDLDMGEIFDDDGRDDDDIGALGPLPDLEDTQFNTQDNEDEENAEVLARLKDLSKGASKKVVRKPQPKLDPTRLTGERGIPVLPKLFENTKFKGKGHEAQDLAVIMRQMEHWAHRLFPKMPFDEVIERVEKLGSKKEVQTCVKKIRLDMPVLDNDFVGSEPEDDDVMRNGEADHAGERNDPTTDNADDVWDALLREEAEVTASQAEDKMSTPVSSNGPSSPPPNNTSIDNNSQSNNMPGGMTPAQIERMERNKQLAYERRLKKLGKNTPGKSMVASQLSQSQDLSQTNLDIQTKDLGIEKIDQVESNKSQALESDKMELDNAKESNSTEQDNIKEPSGVEMNNGEDTYGTKQDNTKKPCGAELDGAKDTNSTASVDSNVNSDQEMSEILDQGPSQVNIVDKFAKNAQDWNTEGLGTNVEEMTADTDKGTDSAEAMDVECSDDIHSKPEPVVDSINSENNQEMSKVIENVDKPILQAVNNDKNAECEATSFNDSEEMSEVIPNQNEVVLERKTNTDKESDSGEMSEVIKNQDNS